MTEDEMVGWHHRLDRPEFEQTPGDSDCSHEIKNACSLEEKL